MKIVGWEIYYADESVVTSREMSWKNAPADGVLVVLVFYEETYKTWKHDKWVIENYRDRLIFTDYYWKDGKVISNGMAKDIPKGLADGMIKIGSVVDDATWRKVIMKAQYKRIWV
jgi:hypothetical protein